MRASPKGLLKESPRGGFREQWPAGLWREWSPSAFLAGVPRSSASGSLAIEPAR